MNTENMIKIIDSQNEQWCERMTYLVSNDEFEDAESLYLEYVVDGEEPENFSWISLSPE
jgi:hypothetical protein